MEEDKLTALLDSSGPQPATATAVAGDDADNPHNPRPDTGRRMVCNRGCERPINVCLCDSIPSEPIATGSTQVVILQHPHERRHKLATVPVLGKCLHSCDVVVGRRLRLGASPLLDSLYNAALENPNRPFRALYLFPGTGSLPAIEISKWQSSVNDSSVKDNVLIAFDGTWKHAKEMVDASFPFLSKFAIRVCLDYDVGKDGGTIFESDLILRKEPFSGCMSTMEAVARALRVLEPNGIKIEDTLVKVLRTMVKFQACHLKPMKPRPKLLKRGKENEKTNKGTVAGN